MKWRGFLYSSSFYQGFPMTRLYNQFIIYNRQCNDWWAGMMCVVRQFCPPHHTRQWKCVQSSERLWYFLEEQIKQISKHYNIMGASRKYTFRFVLSIYPIPSYTTPTRSFIVDNFKCFPRLQGDIICCCDGEADSAVAHLQQWYYAV